MTSVGIVSRRVEQASASAANIHSANRIKMPAGTSRQSMIHNKQKLYELGGTRPDDYMKWDKKLAAEKAAAAGAGHH